LRKEIKRAGKKIKRKSMLYDREKRKSLLQEALVQTGM
jgi:hypothetical protein